MIRRTLFRQAAAALDHPPENIPTGPARVEPPGEEAAAGPIDRGAVWDALSMVIDPEIGLDIVTLGLVYSLEIQDGKVEVTYTLTTPGCPMEAAITGGVVSAVGAVENVEEVIPHLVWEPRWHPGMIQEGAW